MYKTFMSFENKKLTLAKNTLRRYGLDEIKKLQNEKRLTINFNFFDISNKIATTFIQILTICKKFRIFISI